MNDRLAERIAKIEERKEEPYETPQIAFDPIRTLAQLFDAEEGTPLHYLPTKLQLQHIDIDEEDEDYLAKLIMMDNAARILSTVEYDIAQPLKDLCLEIALDIYSDMFDVMSKRYSESIETEDPAQPCPIYEIDIIEYYKGRSVPAVVAANKMVKYLEGVEERLKHIGDASELKYLIGIKLYIDIIKKPEIKQEVKEQLSHPEYTLEDIFIHSIISLHKDFIKAMEELT